MTRTSVLHDQSSLHDLLFSTHIEIHDIYFPNESLVWVTWKYRDETTNFVERTSKNICLSAASYTTSSARIILYNELVQAGNTLLYTDTDSLYWIEKKNSTYKPVIGTGIGQLTDEIAPYGSNIYISEFCAFGPKSYSYRLTDKTTGEVVKEITKCKGLSSSSGNPNNVLNFENMRQMLFEDVRIETSRRSIVRKKWFRVETDIVSKRFQYTFAKRVVTNSFNTWPFGHRLIGTDAEHTSRERNAHQSNNVV